MRFVFTPVSRNAKTGPIPVVTADKATCPSFCRLKSNGCYAEHGPLALLWARMPKAIAFAELLARIRALPRGQVWRYGQAGDLPDSRDDILALAAANRGRPVLCYTHKRDVETYREAGRLGFHINLSADTLDEVDSLADAGLPVVCVLPSRYAPQPGEDVSAYRRRLGGSPKLRTPAGRTVAICPQVYTNTTCLTCRVCTRPRPGGAIIGFPAHGTGKAMVDRVANVGR